MRTAGRYLVVMSLVALVGCFDLKTDLKIKADGSGEVEFDVAMKKEMIAMMEQDASEGPSTPIDDLKSAKKEGVTLLSEQEIETDDGKRHFNARFHFDNLSQLSDESAKFYYEKTAEEITVRVSLTNKGETYGPALDPDRGDTGDAMADSLAEQMKMVFKNMLSGYWFEYVIEMPYPVTKTNATEIESSRAIWKWPMADLVEQPTMMEVTCKIQ